MTLSSSQRRTLESVFRHPPLTSLSWQRVESLLLALGAELSEGRGSRIRIALGSVRAVFHRPHPRKEIGRGALRSLRSFLRTAGFDPEEDDVGL